jgi:hypothetical protein
VKQDGGISLAQLLDKASHMPKRLKVVLAYTIAKSVWQYYNSDWMLTPWTHENIRFLEEKDYGRPHYKPHPYFAVHFKKHEGKILDFYAAEDLIYKYPKVLALGILLIEIATKKPFKSEGYPHLWNEARINDYFEWAWATAAKGDLRGSLYDNYADVVENCLNVDLFRDAPFDEANPEKDMEIRQSILYGKVVLPLKELVKAYSDDWELNDTQIKNTTYPRRLQLDAARQGTVSQIETKPRKLTADPLFLNSDVVSMGR